MSKGEVSLVKPTEDFYTISNTVIDVYTFKCTSKPSSICMTPRDDNGEQAFCQIIIPFTFDEFSKVLSLYEYVYVGVDDEIIQYIYVLRANPLCVYRRGEGGVEG